MARLRPGVTLDNANAELQTLAAQFERDNPDFYAGPNGWQASAADRGPGAKVHFTAQLLHEDLTREARPLLFLLSALVVFVLLTACVNAANLLLARGSARQRELDVRRALGAPRIRIIRQLLTESLVLAVVSAAIGLLGAHFALKAILHQNAWHLPLQARIGIDGTVMLFALLLSVVTCVLSGLMPAWRVTSEKSGQVRAGRTETVGSGTRRLQRTLVVIEVALSIVPLVCGGLMLRSFLNLLHTPLGFDPTNVVTATVPLNLKRYPAFEQRWALLRHVLEEVRALPGVESASAVNRLPLAGQASRRVGRSDRPDSPPILASQQFALPGYLHTMRTPLREGRDFTDEDIATGRGATIIDRELATRLWPEGAIGKRLSIYRTGRRDEVEVIGVTNGARLTRVRDEKHTALHSSVRGLSGGYVFSGQESERRGKACGADQSGGCDGRYSSDERICFGFDWGHALHDVCVDGVRGSFGAADGDGSLWDVDVFDAATHAGVRDSAGDRRECQGDYRNRGTGKRCADVGGDCIRIACGLRCIQHDTRDALRRAAFGRWDAGWCGGAGLSRWFE